MKDYYRSAFVFRKATYFTRKKIILKQLMKVSRWALEEGHLQAVTEMNMILCLLLKK